MSRQRTSVRNVSRTGTAIRKASGTTLVNISQSGSAEVYRSTCTDVLGRKFDHPLYIEKVSKEWSGLNGRVPANNFQTYREYVNYDCYSTRADAAHINMSVPSENASMTDAMARTNPSRSAVNIPAFLGELKDWSYLPANIRDKGRVLNNQLKTAKEQHKRGKYTPQKLADAYLTWEFGIAPLIRDLQKIANFQASVDRKVKELDRLFSKGGMRRRVSIFTQSAQNDQNNFAIESALGVVFTTRIMTTTTMRRWATFRWLPLFDKPYTDDASKRALASQLVAGMNVNGAVEAAWELMPWSWMIDWFTGMGTYLQAHNNSVPAQCVNRCVMTHTLTNVRYTRTDNNVAYSGGEATFTRETKARSVGLGTSLDVKLPFLSGNQLSILGSLSIARG